MEKCLIVAVADDGAIGVHGDLPWHISEDLKYFKRTTSGYPVIMGRTTWNSLPFRPLKGRKNIVLTKSVSDIPGVVCVGSLEEAFREAETEATDRCFVMGGASVYREAIGVMDRLFVTHVHTDIPGADAYFPEINGDIWRVETRSESFMDEETGYSYEFVVYVRRRNP